MGWWEEGCAWDSGWYAYRKRKRYCVPNGYCSNWQWVNLTCTP